MSRRTRDAFEQAAETERKARRKHPPPFSIRFTEAERAYLDQAAGALSLAAFIRLKLFDDAPEAVPKRKATRKPLAPSAELAVLAQMLAGLGQSRLASNLNQIARATNVGALPVTPELERDLHEACAAITGMRADLIAALGIKNQEGAP